MSNQPDVSAALPTALAGALFFGVLTALIALFAVPGSPSVARIPSALLVGGLWSIFGALVGAVSGAFSEPTDRQATPP